MSVIKEIHDDLEKGAARLVAEYRDKLCAEAFSICGDSAEAEDFAFRAFAKAVSRIDSFKNEETSLYSWMRAILVNDIRSAKRTKAAQNTVVAEPDAELPLREGAPGTAEYIMANSDAEVVRRAIMSLSGELRETILLHYFLEQPVGKMAKLLAIPEGTVKFRLHCARKALAEILSRQMKRPVVRLALLAFGLAAFAGTVLVGRVALKSGSELGGSPSTAAVGDATGGGLPAAQEHDIFDNNNGEENMIMARKMASLVGATMLSSMLPGTELMSERTFVFLRPETSSFWHTATNNTLTLPIDYPLGATRATLTVSGVKYSYSTNLPANTAEFDLELPAPTSPQTENVYDLTLSFDKGASRTARLGLVQGLSPDSEGTTRCLAPAEGRVWNTVKKQAVLPIPYGATALSVEVGGETTVTELDGSQGWFALRAPAGKDFSLLLLGDGFSHAVSLFGLNDGTMVIFQ